MHSVRWRGCRWPSRSRSPDRRVPRSRARRAAVKSARDQHLAVGQQRRRVKARAMARLPVAAPGPGRRIVEFRAREIAAAGVNSSCDEHLAVGQQRRRVKVACGGEAAGGRPSPARRIVEFRARESAAVVRSSCDEHLAVGQQRRRVISRVRWRGCRWPSTSR